MGDKFDRKIGDLDKKVDTRLAEVERKVDTSAGRLGLELKNLELKMDGKMDTALESVAALEERLDKQERDFPAILEGFWSDKIGSMPSGARPASGATELGREERYWKARRSLRMWPLEDGTREKLAVFLLSKLGMPYQVVDNLGPLEIAPASGNGKGRIQREFVVTFENKEERDRVRSNASKLALLPKDTAGIRLKLPDFLQSTFNVLQNAAYQIKKKNPAAKRNILFDDNNLNLALDVKVNDASEWKRILPDDARAAGARPGRGPNGRENLDAASISSMMSE